MISKILCTARIETLPWLKLRNRQFLSCFEHDDVLSLQIFNLALAFYRSVSSKVSSIRGQRWRMGKGGQLQFVSVWSWHDQIHCMLQRLLNCGIKLGTHRCACVTCHGGCFRKWAHCWLLPCAAIAVAEAFVNMGEIWLLVCLVVVVIGTCIQGKCMKRISDLCVQKYYRFHWGSNIDLWATKNYGGSSFPGIQDVMTLALQATSIWCKVQRCKEVWQVMCGSLCHHC